MSMTPTALRLPSGSPLPSDSDEFEAWRRDQESRLAWHVNRALHDIERHAADGIPDSWEQFLVETYGPLVRAIHRDAAAFGARRLDSVGEWAEQADQAADEYAEGAIQRLRAVGRELWVQANVESLTASAKDGISKQAEAVARTEAAAAAARGQREGAYALPGNQQPRLHMWRSMEDSRVRFTHVDANDQIQLFWWPFIVGGWHMLHPHDPSGGIEETANCRCIEILLYEGDTLPGGQVVDSALEDYIANPERQAQLGLRAPASETENLPQEQKDAIMRYSKGAEVNRGLRGLDPTPPDPYGDDFLGIPGPDDVKHIDAALANSTLESPVRVRRDLGLDSFPMPDDPKSLIGREFSDAGYLSTSRDMTAAWLQEQMLNQYDYPVQLVMRLPKGTHALDISHLSAFPEQREILLARNSRFVVDDVVHSIQKTDEWELVGHDVWTVYVTVIP